MAKRRPVNEDEFQTLWKKLPESDQRFLCALITVSEAVRDETLRYHELSTRVGKMVLAADRDTLFSVTVECLGRLFDAPALQRIKRGHRCRKNGPPVHKTTRGKAAPRRARRQKKEP